MVVGLLVVVAPTTKGSLAAVTADTLPADTKVTSHPSVRAALEKGESAVF